MRRVLLMAVFGVLVVLDLMLLPTAIISILVGSILGVAGFPVSGSIYMIFMGIAVGGVLTWLTLFVFRALHRAHPSSGAGEQVVL